MRFIITKNCYDPKKLIITDNNIDERLIADLLIDGDKIILNKNYNIFEVDDDFEYIRS